jgi:hypothetical protein
VFRPAELLNDGWAAMRPGNEQIAHAYGPNTDRLLAVKAWVDGERVQRDPAAGGNLDTPPRGRAHAVT